MSFRMIEVTADDDGQRLDRWLKKTVPDVPYVLLQKLIRKGALRVDGKRVKTDIRLSEGQAVKIPAAVQGAKSLDRKVEKLNDKDVAFVKSLIIYQDEDIIAINKPSGLAVQGGTNTTQHLDRLLSGLADDEGVNPRLVHRLDKDTSGVLILARSAKVAKAMGAIFKGQKIKKTYVALCHGVPEMAEGTIKAPLIKAGGLNRERMVVDEEEGKFAATDYVVIDRAGDQVSFISFSPLTGRTHQIRVHAELAGFPIIGDHKYRGEGHEAPDVEMSERLHLHAYRLVFDHPMKAQTMDIVAQIPKALRKSWSSLGFDPHLKHDPFEEMG